MNALTNSCNCICVTLLFVSRLQTDQTKMRLKGYPTGIYPGAKCHFMVASVNTHGSRGFSKVAPYIKSK